MIEKWCTIVAQMSEIIHPQFDANFRPDLGGTSYDFVKEIGKDKLSFYHRSGDHLTKIEIPSPESFLKISLSDGLSGDFLEARFNHTGDLTFATIHFRKYCKQDRFMERACPNDDFLDLYWDLEEKNEDIILDVDLKNKLIIATHGEYLPNGDMQAIATWEAGLPINEAAIMELGQVDGDELGPVKFAVSYRDNILSIGLVTNENSVAQDSISTYASSKELSTKSTPKDVVKFLQKVFLKIF